MPRRQIKSDAAPAPMQPRSAATLKAIKKPRAKFSEYPRASCRYLGSHARKKCQQVLIAMTITTNTITRRAKSTFFSKLMPLEAIGPDGTKPGGAADVSLGGTAFRSSERIDGSQRKTQARPMTPII